MNVNGSFFHLLLGKDDWGRCRLVLGDQPLNAWPQLIDGWKEQIASPPALGAALEPLPLGWDMQRQELRLQAKLIEIGPTPGEASFNLDSRRCADADQYGNIYWIGDDSSQLRVWSVGSDRESAFWPDQPVDCAEKHQPPSSDFRPLKPEQPLARKYTALAVTEDHYLLAAFTGATNKGLQVFDLMAGGLPVEILWPPTVELQAFDMVRRQGGGVWILDRVNKTVWELDRRLGVVGRQKQPQDQGSDAETGLFNPVEGEVRTMHESHSLSLRERPALSPSTSAQDRPVGGAGVRGSNTEVICGIDLQHELESTIDPIAIETTSDGNLLILDRGNQESRIFRLLFNGCEIKSEGPCGLGQLAQDFVVGQAAVRDADASPVQLFVATGNGNQALAFGIGPNEPLVLTKAVELFPLRLFSGRALLMRRGAAWYDSGTGKLRWVPVVQHPRARYEESAELISPVLDGMDFQCLWDRVLLDACIPADARIEIRCRVADEKIASPNPDRDYDLLSAWVEQPLPYLRSNGPELPWLRMETGRGTRPASGIGCWELLLQNMRGRYLQLKLSFSGNGNVTPRLRALRVWYPRFSYAQRFLPAVYREDATSASFIDRFLANFEGINTTLEGRIAQAQALFDTRTAPAETLAWLASWFGVALDPAWEEWRRRLFINQAINFFNWRGTTHGLCMALRLALDDCMDEHAFDPPSPDSGLYGIRIVEAYLTRLTGALAAGDPGGQETGLQMIKLEKLWTPQEDNGGLFERFRNFEEGVDVPIGEEVRGFWLAPPYDKKLPEQDNATRLAFWKRFCQASLGFIPKVCEEERLRWQYFLSSLYSATDEHKIALNQEYGVEYPDFPGIQLPADWPQGPAAAKDWGKYCTLPDTTRNLKRWQDFLARRYRYIGRLNEVYHTQWPAFDLISLPDRLPHTREAQTDWLQFESQLLPIVRTAHQFTVLLPVFSVKADPYESDQRLKLTKRIVDLEKPAHTVFDIRFYWAMNRLGEARLGYDTQLGAGSRAPELMPDAELGKTYVGASFAGGPQPPLDGDRILLTC